MHWRHVGDGDKHNDAWQRLQLFKFSDYKHSDVYHQRDEAWWQHKPVTDIHVITAAYGWVSYNTIDKLDPGK